MSPRRAILLSIGFLLFLFATLILLPSFGFERMNAELQEVDIANGKIRFTRYLFYVPISSKEQETSISRILPPAQRGLPKWHPVNLFYAGSKISSHYRFHSAINQIDRIELAWSVSNISDTEKMVYAQRIVSAWQHGMRDLNAGPIVDEIEEQASILQK